MEKKLPSVFANKIKKELTNNEKVYISSREIKKQEKILEENNIKKQKTYEKNIEQKINEIIKSKKNLYKIPVNITVNNIETTKYIIGKNNKALITIENELIPIEQIQNIKMNK